MASMMRHRVDRLMKMASQYQAQSPAVEELDRRFKQVLADIQEQPHIADPAVRRKAFDAICRRNDFPTLANSKRR